MFVKRNDNVKMLVGKDHGKIGKILFVFPDRGRVVVEGLNKIKKHMKSKKQGQKGQIIEKERAIDISDVQLICSKCNKPTRMGYRREGDKKIRYCKKCDAIN